MHLKIGNCKFVLFYRLDLDLWINDPPSESSEDEDIPGIGAVDIFVKTDKLTDGMYNADNYNKQPELTEEELEKVNSSAESVA